MKEATEMLPAEEIPMIIKGPTKTRTTAPGRTRVTVSITDDHIAQLTKMAKEESVVFPRATNEFLSILIEKNFTALTGESK